MKKQYEEDDSCECCELPFRDCGCWDFSTEPCPECLRCEVHCQCEHAGIRHREIAMDQGHDLMSVG